jgi:hypothetical protein
VIFAQDDDGSIYPVTRDELARVWVWQKGKLHSQLVMAEDAGAVIEAQRREGWHAWATPAVMMRVD